MAVLNFPAAPVVNDVYTANGAAWKWNGESWIGVPATNYLFTSCIFVGLLPASQVLLDNPVPAVCTFAAALAGSVGTLDVAATAQTDFDVQKNGVSFGTMRFAAAGTVASFIAASSASFAMMTRPTFPTRAPCHCKLSTRMAIRKPTTRCTRT